MKLFAAITKAVEQDDGTLMVEGIASTESVDSQGEVIKASAIEAALPDYMRHGTGALREMHQPLAAGTAMASVVDGVTTIKAHVVDPIAVKKVTAGVYKGFSVGGKITERDSVDKNMITGIKLVEISLVDRPANPDAVLLMHKFEDGEEAPAGDDTVEKSFWNIATLASILADLKCLQNCAEWDAAYDGEATPVPAQLKDAVGTLADILVGMVQEEVKDDAVEAADKVGDVVKGDEPVVAAVVDPVVEAPAIVEPPVAKADEPDMAKVEDLIAKAVATAIEPLTKANTDLTAEIEKLKAVPAPKGAVMAVNKGDDAPNAPKADDVEPVTKADGTIDEIATEMKKIHRAGAIS